MIARTLPSVSVSPRPFICPLSPFLSTCVLIHASCCRTELDELGDVRQRDRVLSHDATLQGTLQSSES